MRIGTVSLVLTAVISCSFATKASAQFSEAELAETIAYDTGYPPEGYEAYAASLVKTLASLSPAQVERAFKGKRPRKLKDKPGNTVSPQPGGSGGKAKGPK